MVRRAGGDPGPVGPIAARIARLAEQGRDAGFVLDDGLDLEDQRARDLADMLDRRWQSRVPVEYRNATVDRLDGDLRDAVGGWASMSGPHPNLVLLGPTGSGKTFAAVAAVRSAHWACLSVAVYSVPRFLFDVRPGSPVADRTMDVVLNADRLVFDDVGTEAYTDWRSEQLWLVTNERRNMQGPIVATSNLSVDALADRVGERVASRLLGGATIVEVRGHDRRRVVSGDVTTTTNGAIDDG